mmetsp:Transcript_4003/g.12528  ORF Transcript_4003/g.12528 Transcript_4003/m.12528 type:complete len:119 (+) Transcript_4003:101-457(+)
MPPKPNGGVECIIERAGDGRYYPKKGETIAVHYVGTLDNGKVFDSSYSRGRPFRFKVGVGQVVPGWDEAVKQLSVGEKARCIVPADLAYGNKGIPGLIPPGATLYLEIELISIVTSAI